MTPKNNHVTVIGLPKDTDFSQWVKGFINATIPAESQEWVEFKIEDPWTLDEGISFPQFCVTAKPALYEELLTYSARPEAKDLIFHLAWYELEGSNRAGVATFKNGEWLRDWWTGDNCGSEIAFADIRMPLPDFLVEHAGLTLAQLTKYRLQQAAKVFENVSRVLNERVGKGYMELRDAAKTAKVTAEVTALAETLESAVEKLDFTDVILRLEKIQEADEREYQLTVKNASAEAPAAHDDSLDDCPF